MIVSETPSLCFGFGPFFDSSGCDFAIAQSSKDGPMGKLTHSLVRLYAQHVALQSQRNSAPFSFDDPPLVTLVNDSVVVDAVASGDVNPKLSKISFVKVK